MAVKRLLPATAPSSCLHFCECFVAHKPKLSTLENSSSCYNCQITNKTYCDWVATESCSVVICIVKNSEELKGPSRGTTKVPTVMAYGCCEVKRVVAVELQQRKKNTIESLHRIMF